MSLPEATWTWSTPTLAGGATTTHVAEYTPGVDLQLDTAGDLTIGTDLTFTTGLAAVQQGIRVRLQMFLGEWFNDLTRGVPWFQSILGARFNASRLRQIFHDTIAAAPGVTAIPQLTVNFNRAGRALNVAFRAQTTYGTTSATLSIPG